MISTRDLSQLPDITRLRRLCQSLAMLDAIIEPDESLRYHSFRTHWRTDEELAFMRNGSGDEYSVLFIPAGAILRGFAHESPMSPYRRNPPILWPGVLEEVPSAFSQSLWEPAFMLNETTFCIWRTQSDNSWHRGNISFPEGPDPDGSAQLLALLDGNPETYQQWAEDYYERPMNLAGVTHIYKHRPLSQQVVTRLNPELSLADLATDIQQSGYGTG